jgi:monofunctional biosynthetic peptidoglycan transglycosylase
LPVQHTGYLHKIAKVLPQSSAAAILQLARRLAKDLGMATATGKPSKQRQPQPATSAPGQSAGTRRLVLWAKRCLLWGTLGLLLLPPLQALLLRYVDPPVTHTMLSVAVRHGLDSGEWRLPDYDWQPLQLLPRHALVAALSSEDRKFLQHRGFDVASIRRAWSRLQRNTPGGKVVGGSTISQQVARNVFLWQHRSWLRKGLEAWYTVWLETFVSKERILEVYLNIAEMGPMVFGLEAASQHWYHKPARLTRPADTAALIALLPAPARWRPTDRHVQRRVAWMRSAPARLPADFARTPPATTASRK